ncbi:MAG: hypothetical protein AAF808_03750 [Cyanobacteria bacterium P01_D01_bin.2]
MNIQLANSLAEAVSALSLEDFQVFQAALLEHMVEKRRVWLGAMPVFAIRELPCGRSFLWLSKG